MSRDSVESTSRVWGAGTSWATSLGAFFEASSIFRPSARFMAIRASHSTCLPCSSAAMAISQCVYGHVPMHTASTSGDFTTSRQSPCTRLIPNSLATRSPDSTLRFATDTSSTPESVWKPGMCRVRVLLPAPMNPTRIAWSLMARHCSTTFAGSDPAKWCRRWGGPLDGVGGRRSIRFVGRAGNGRHRSTEGPTRSHASEGVP